MNSLGWIGGILLAFCALPEAFSSFRKKRCDLSWGFLSMWGLGEVFILIPVIGDKMAPFLLFNYSLNIVIISVLIYFKTKTLKQK